MTIDLLLKSCLVLVIAMVAIKAMARSSAASRHLAWTGAFVALLALPIARGVVPDLPLRVLPAVTSVIVPTMAAVPMREEAFSTASVMLASAASSVTGGSETAATQPAAPMFGSRVTFADAFQFIWLAGIAVLALRAGVGVLLLRRVVRRTRVADDRWILDRVEAARGALNLGRRVRVLIAADNAMPATWGIARPTLILPASASGWREQYPARLDAVLTHELSHVARRDAVSQLVARAAVALFWYNPLVWFAARQARLERERACDDAVLANGTTASSYAEELMALLRTMSPAARPALSMARESQIERRVSAILDVRANRDGVSRVSALGVALFVIFAGPLASVHLAARVASRSQIVREAWPPATAGTLASQVPSATSTVSVAPTTVGRSTAHASDPVRLAAVTAPFVSLRQAGPTATQALTGESWPQYRARSLEIVQHLAELLLSGAKEKVEIGTLSVRDTPVFEETLEQVRRVTTAAPSVPPADPAAVATRFDAAFAALEMEVLRFNVGLASGPNVCRMLLDALYLIVPRPPSDATPPPAGNGVRGPLGLYFDRPGGPAAVPAQARDAIATATPFPSSSP